MTKARNIASLLSTANGKIAGNNLDVSFENITDTGTEGTRVATGTTAQRGSTTGQLRFNTDTGLAEYYTGSEFKAIDTPPTITSVDVTNVETDLGGTQTFVINGSLFNGSATVKFRDNGGTLITPDTTTINSASLITVTKTRSSFSNANEPYDIIVNNPSGLSTTLENAINVDNSPVFDIASGTLGTLPSYDREGSNLTTITATDPDGDTVTFSYVSGTLPTGLLLNSNGTFSGTANAETTNTTYTFIVRATANNKTVDRQYTITVNAPQIYALTSGSGTWTRPSGLTSSSTIKLLLVGGGGGAGGSQTGDPSGGGGGGGLIYITNFVTAQSSYTYSIGNGGQGGQGGADYGSNGGTTSFASSGSGTLNANGGGGGGGTTYGQSVNGNSGGSGGGSGSYNGSGGGSNQTTSFTIDSTFYSNVGFGNSGSGGNGGAGGGAGGSASGDTGGAGLDVSATFGTSYGNSGVFAKGGSDSGNLNGGANTGDGASSAYSTAPNRNGGSGIILLYY
jgi:hypothetical protein